MKYDLVQTNSVFEPGLTRRGPVFNAGTNFGDLPSLSPTVQFALEAGLLAAGLFKKIPLPYAVGGAALLYFLFSQSSSTAVAAPTTGAAANAASPGMPIDTSSLNQVPTLNTSNIPMPTVGAPSS
jgi:hypothetical protein